MTHLLKRLMMGAASILLVTAPWSGVADAGELESRQDGEKVGFVEIKPLIAKYCLRCHGPEEQKADFRVDDRETVFLYIEPGDPENSEWHERLTTDDTEYLMPPPDEGGPLPEDDVAMFANWIQQGAEWPEGATIEPPPAEVAVEAKQEIETKRQQQDQQDSSWKLLWEICGLLHPVAVHFPVALLIAGAVFAILGFRGESPMSDAAYYCLWLGALGAILACASGWSFAIREGYLNWQSVDLNRSIDLHRWGGIVVAVLAFLLAMVASISRRRDPYGTGALWKLSLVILAGLVGFVSHQGGKMTHDGLHEEMLDKAKIVVDNIRGVEQPPPAQPTENPTDSGTDAKSPPGNQSGSANTPGDADEGSAKTSGSDDEKDQDEKDQDEKDQAEKD